MKIVQKSQNGKMLKIADPSFDKDTWYFMSDQVKGYVDKSNIDIGTEVEIRTEDKNGSKNIVFLKVAGSANTTVTAPTTVSTKEYVSPERGKYQQRDPTTQESIVRQTAMKCAVECLKPLQGMISPDDVAEVAIAIYSKLLAKIQESK